LLLLLSIGLVVTADGCCAGCEGCEIVAIRCIIGHWCDKSSVEEQRGPPAVDDHGGDCYWHLLDALCNPLWSMEYHC